MRLTRVFLPVILCLTLTACVSSLLVGNQLQSRLMWAVLKPLVGFDPNEVNLFEIPLVQERMTALLGDACQPTVDLLRTADRIQQEGALIYVASRVIDEVVALPLPEDVALVQEQVEQVQAVQEQVEQTREQLEQAKAQVEAVQENVAEIKEQVKVVRSAAGMVWNGDTNQLAVVLLEKGVSAVFAEQLPEAPALEPVWPVSIQPLLEAGAVTERPVAE